MTVYSWPSAWTSDAHDAARVTSLRAFVRDVIELISIDRRRRWIWAIALAVVVSFVESGAALLIYALLGYLVSPVGGLDLPLIGDIGERFPNMGQDDLIVTGCLAVALVFLLRAPLVAFQQYAQTRIAHNTGVDISARLLRGYLEMPWSFHLQRNSAGLIRTAFSSVTQTVALVLLPVVALITDIFITIGLLAVMFISAPTVTLLTSIMIGPLALVIMRTVRPRLIALGEETQQVSMENLKILQQSLEGTRDVVLTRSETFFVDEFARTRRQLAHANYQRAVIAELPRLSVETAAMVFLLAFTAVTVRSPGDLSEALPTLGVLAYAVLRVLPAINRIGGNINNVRFGQPALALIHADFRATAEAAGNAPRAEGAITFADSIELENVSFTYENANRAAVEDLHLTITRGQSVGIVGPTGSGKSTVIDLILGLLTPTAGAVLVDGVDIRGRERSWHELLGVVSQSVYLLDDTIRRNIAFGERDHEIDDTRLAEALELSQLDELIVQLPDGLHTRVGERGIQLSGGQRQRVAIARALYRRPEVLVFDEGTSALDNETEGQLLRALEMLRGARTVIAVAHRLSTVRDCDQIFVIRGGRLVEHGTYGELERSGSVFQSMLQGAATSSELMDPSPGRGGSTDP